MNNLRLINQVKAVFTILKFLILAGGALFVVVFLASGAIGYLFYSSSSSSDVPPSIISNWREEFREIPRQVLVTGAIVLAAIWVLVGGGSAEQETGKPEFRKGRKRRHFDED